MLKNSYSLFCTMRILLLGDYGAVASGGISRTVTLIADALRKDHEVKVISVLPDGSAKVITADASRVQEALLPPRKRFLCNIPFLKKFVPIAFPLFAADKKRLGEEIRTFSPDIIDCHRPFYAGIALCQPYPKVFSVHGIFDKEIDYGSLPFRILYYPHKNHFRKALAAFPALITPSAYVTSMMRVSMPGQVFEIPPPVSDIFFTGRRKRVPGQLLCVSRVIQQKLPLEFFRNIAGVLRRDEGLRLHIIGPKTRRTHLRDIRSFVDQQGIAEQVIFHGSLGDEDLKERYAQCEMLIHPSQHETFGLVNAEAMAGGSPVVTMDTEGVAKEITSGENGIVCSTYPELALQVEKLHQDESLQRSVGLNGKKLAWKWKCSATMKLRIKAYEQIIAKQKVLGRENRYEDYYENRSA